MHPLYVPYIFKGDSKSPYRKCRNEEFPSLDLNISAQCYREDGDSDSKQWNPDMREKRIGFRYDYRNINNKNYCRDGCSNQRDPGGRPHGFTESLRVP